MMTIAQLLREGTQQLEKAGITEADLECLLLLGHCLKMSRTELFLRGRDVVDHSTMRLFSRLLTRRAAREPLAYIVGYREFWSLNFVVNRNVLIPRPETEFLLETVLDQIRASALPVNRGVDMCCGSGVVAVVLARELRSQMVACDCSLAALTVCQQNCRKHGVTDMVALLCTDLFQGVSGKAVFSYIVANPPYVQSSAIENELDPEVADYEPRLALDGGKDGLEWVRKIARQVVHHLEPGGFFFMEFGDTQAETIHRLFSGIEQDGRYFQMVNILQDYSGRDRVLVARLNHYSR